MQTADHSDLTAELQEVVFENLRHSSKKNGQSVDSKSFSGWSWAKAFFKSSKVQSGMSARVVKKEAVPVYHIRLSLAGAGSKEELLLLDSLALSISSQLLQGTAALNGRPDVQSHGQGLVECLDLQASVLEDEWLGLAARMQQFDQGLSSVYKQVKSHKLAGVSLAESQRVNDVLERLRGLVQEVRQEVGKDDSVLWKSDAKVWEQRLAQMGSELQSMVKPEGQRVVSIYSGVKHSDAGFREILDLLEQLDTEEIEDQLSRARKALQANMVLQREKIGTFVSLVKQSNFESGFVHRNTRTTCRPIGGVPDRDLLAVFLVGSLLTAVFVCCAYRPELVDRGFRSDKQMSQVLGLPVVAKFEGAGNFRKNHRPLPVGLANRFVMSAEIALWVVVLLIVVSCLFNSAIRDSFSENLFSGLARLTWTFFIN